MVPPLCALSSFCWLVVVAGDFLVVAITRGCGLGWESCLPASDLFVPVEEFIADDLVLPRALLFVLLSICIERDGDLFAVVDVIRDLGDVTELLLLFAC